MSLTEFVLLIGVGFVAGLVGYITGLASVVSYPALLAVGLPPIIANVTNTVALVSSGVGSFAQSGRVLLGDGRRELGYGVLAAVVGGVIGAVLLLTSPPGTFEAVVPYLVALAALALLIQPWLRRVAQRNGGDRPALFLVSVLVIAVYGGYFGAGAGILFLAAALVVTSAPMWRAVLLKAVLLGVANLVAAIGFAIFAPVHWWAALAMGIGCLAGGWCGPPVVKRLPAEPLRIVVGIAGLGLAVWLGVG